jgi:RNA polymerase sigma-70 factor (ECF subfamily)
LKTLERKTNHNSETDLKRRDLEQKLIAAAQAGSSTAFAELYGLYAKALYRIAYSFTKNREDAEDALQDASLRAYSALAHFRREAQFYSWIVRITINSSLMILRKHRRRREVSVDGVGPEENSSSFDFADVRPGPEDFCEKRQTYAHLVRSIEGLPIHLRVVAELRLLHEQSIDETQSVLGISEAAVKSRLFRARTKLVAAHGCTYRQREFPAERTA